MDSIHDLLSHNLVSDRDKYIVGFADMTGLLHESISEFSYAISIARKLDDEIIDGISGGPTRDYSDHYNEINSELAGVVKAISRNLEENGYENIAIGPTVSDTTMSEDYLRTLRMPFSHKMAATRSGLGWIGKTDLLVTKQFGPRVRLASILLKDKPDSPGIPIEHSFCGNCNVCVVSCPAQAATGGLWDTGIDRDNFYNAFKCMEKCRELSLTALNQHISLCGICLSVCPRGKT